MPSLLQRKQTSGVAVSAGRVSLMFCFFEVGKEDECVYLYERLFREPPSNFPIEIKIASEHLDL